MDQLYKEATLDALTQAEGEEGIEELSRTTTRLELNRRKAQDVESPRRGGPG